MSVCVCVCVCMREREREREIQKPSSKNSSFYCVEVIQNERKEN